MSISLNCNGTRRYADTTPFHHGHSSGGAQIKWAMLREATPPDKTILRSIASLKSMVMKRGIGNCSIGGERRSRNDKMGSVFLMEGPPDGLIDVAESRPSFSGLAPLEAILFDIDGTLCDSDPIHYYAFREMLREIGFNGGEPITEEFFSKNISGKHNEDICHVLFPDWDLEKSMKFMDDKEVMFRRLAPEQLKPVSGLHKLCKWIVDHGLKRAAVTNAPRENAELMISILGLSDFFELLVVGSECERAKPFPDPYLKALQVIKASPDHTFVFEDSASGIKAGVAAGLPVVGIITRNPDELLMGAGATFLIKDFEDPKLWAALEEVTSEASTEAPN